MVDYSKWDNLEVSSDEEDHRPLPKVTRLKSPANIKIGGDGWESTSSAVGASAAQAPPPKKPVDGADSVAALSTNGGVTETYMWSQTKDEVVAHVRVPKSSRAVEMTVTLKAGRLEVRSSQQGEGEAALAGELLHPVVEDEEGDGDVDWELTDWPTSAPLASSSRKVTITMRKRILTNGMEFTPGESVVLWWSSLLKGGPTIDTGAIAGRKGVASMRETWEQAQEMFRQKVAAHKPVIIDPAECGPDSDEEA